MNISPNVIHRPIWLIRLALFAIAAFLVVTYSGRTLGEDLSREAEGPVDWLIVYFMGRPRAAIDHWRETLPSLKESLSIIELVPLTTTVAWYCALANDDNCVMDTAQLVGGLTIPNDLAPTEREILHLHVGFVFGLSAAATRDPEAIADFLSHGFLGPQDHLFFSPILYIKRAFLAAQLHLVVDDHKEADAALQRGLAALASLTTARPSIYDYAALLTQALRIMHELGQNIDAFGLTAFTSDSLLEILPEHSIERVRHMDIRAQLLFDSMLFERSRLLAEQATALYESLDLPRYNFAEERLTLHTIRAASCAMEQAGADCINEALRDAWAETEYYDRSGLGELPTPIEVSLAAIEVVVRSISGQNLDFVGSRAHALRRFLATPQQNDLELESARLLALSLLSHWEKDPTAPKLASSSLELLLTANALHNTERIGSMLFPAGTLRLIALVATSILLESGTPDSHQSSLILQATEMYSRSGPFKTSDALAELAASVTSGDRAARHSLQRIRSRIAFYRNKAIGAHIAEIDSAGPSEPGLAATDFYAHGAFQRLLSESARLAEHLQTRGNLSRVPYFPQATDVQELLQPGEVLLSVGNLLGSAIVSICVTPDSISAKPTEIDSQLMDSDLRLLRMALTASHPPSVIADSQFPVQAAQRLYDAVLREQTAGAYRCINPGDTVFVAPAHLFGGVPIEITLADDPARDENGWLLGTAPWAMRNNDFVYLPSVRAFVAQRRLQSQPRITSQEVLSVGDPTLNVLSPAAEELVASVTRSAQRFPGDHSLSALLELPNTADEARDVHESLGGTGRLLIGDHATERAIRSDFLSRYRYIHLATHGLIREELRGLHEAALVLTPESSVDPLNDGLLTAGEIADLTLNADIAVLSACNTANFDLEFFQSETQGLSTAFAIAGVPATVVTLWPVETLASEMIVTSFFQNLSKGQVRASRALSISKSHLLSYGERPFHHPRFWAPFILYGDSQARAMQADSSFEKLLFLDAPGAVHDIAAVPDTRDTLVFWGRYRDQGPLSRISRLDESLAEIWRHDREQFGRFKLLPRQDGVVVALGYEFRDNLPFPALLALESETGREIAYEPLGEPGRPGYVLGAATRADMNTIVLIGQASDAYGGHTDESIVTFSVEELDPNLRRVSLHKLPVAQEGGMPSAFAMAVTGSYLLASITERPSFEAQEHRVGYFGNVEVCTAPPDTRLVLLDAASFDLKSIHEIQGLSIRRLIASADGTFIFAGMEHSSCTHAKRVVVGRIMPGISGWQRLYADPTPMDSFAATMVQNEDGSLVLASTITKIVDESFVNVTPEEYTARLLSNYTLMNRGAIRALRVTWLTAHGELIDEMEYSGGADSFADAMMLTADGVLVGGEIGATPFILLIPSVSSGVTGAVH